MLKLRDGRLHVFKQPRCQNYYYRFFDSGKYITRTTQTANLALAKSVAENAYDSFKFTATNKHSHSFDAAERGLLTALSVESNSHEGIENKTSSSRLQSYKVKLNVLRKFFGSMTIDEINKTKMIEEYVTWRREIYKTHVHRNVVSNKTLRRDFDVLRAILKHAKREEWIDNLCDFPRLSAPVNSTGWFTNEEWKYIQKVAKQWIKEAKNDNERGKRKYVYDFMMFLVHTGMRVDEAKCVRYRDVELDKDDPNICYITVVGGKLKDRLGKTDMIGFVGATKAIEHRKKANPGFKDTDVVFDKDTIQRVRNLLIKANLYRDADGNRRTAKNFRHTFMKMRLDRKVTAFDLSQNCRTSLRMIETHYIRKLNPRLRRNELAKGMLKELSKKGDHE